ncbi:glycosyltransferase family protein [Longimicrobium sp.]|uniref:glycosyltransferase family protein n=1 Tax=Longimicrobium sp. TaxID=2029185 RepID=UPI002E2F06F9|nr:glycosyltransferase family protein [Longimicrobium sp.]HEX6037057.1 glycosyltransferase family protein [Longimicrobium sp.]
MSRPRVVALVQARMGSTRLPGKVLLDLGGEPVLARVMDRLGRARSLDAVVVATTLEPEAARIVELCGERGWAVTRGSTEDLLDRYHHAAREHGAQVVVRVTSDCPLIDPEVVDRVVEAFLADPSLDYCSNTIPPRTFPRGLDTEAFSFAALERAWREDDRPDWREHVTPYLYRNPDRFRLRVVTDEVDRSDMRWTVDTPEDLAFARTVYAHFGNGDAFGWRDVLAALEAHPDWARINAHVEQKVVR